MQGDESIELTIVYERVEGGWTQATVPAVPGVITAARTRTAARRSVRDALRLFLSTPPEFDPGSRETETLELRWGGHGRPLAVDRDIDR